MGKLKTTAEGLFDKLEQNIILIRGVRSSQKAFN